MVRNSPNGCFSTAHKLLTGAWTDEVETVETAMIGLTANTRLKNDCRVVFFEIVRDAHLHVNVTHKHQTREVQGWAGPAYLPEGFVHNRTFADVGPKQMIRNIREMVFAARL